MRFGQAAGGRGLTAGARKTIERLTGAGVPLEEALGLAASLGEAGQLESLEGLTTAAFGLAEKHSRPAGVDMYGMPTEASAVSVHGALRYLLSGEGTGEAPAVAPILAALRGRGSLGTATDVGAGIMAPGLLRNELSATLAPDVRAEYAIRAAERSQEIVGNLAAERVGPRARLTAAVMATEQAAAAAEGDVLGSAAMSAGMNLYGADATARITGQTSTIERMLEQVEINTRGGGRQ